jgi:hypothetical protein
MNTKAFTFSSLEKSVKNFYKAYKAGKVTEVASVKEIDNTPRNSVFAVVFPNGSATLLLKRFVQNGAKGPESVICGICGNTLTEACYASAIEVDEEGRFGSTKVLRDADWQDKGKRKHMGIQSMRKAGYKIVVLSEDAGKGFQLLPF